jgi:hypothetical protein
MEPGALVSKRLLTGKQDKSKFSEEQRRVWGEKEEEIFQDPVLVKWVREGGPPPATFT